MKNTDSTDTQNELEWWQSLDGILEKFEGIYKENLELKKEIAILKQKKPINVKSKTTKIKE
jgi:hypothetical protein